MVGYEKGKKTNLTNSFWSGVLGGMCTRVVVSPLDVLKIRFQLQADMVGSRSKYNSIPQATLLIFKEEGFTAFWKGHCPAQLLSIIYGGMQFMTFEYLTEVAYNVYPINDDQVTAKTFAHLLCGCGAGVAASVTAHPVDVLRTRFAAQKEPKIYTSMYGATRQIVSTEGWSSFFRGLTPSLVQVAPQTGVSFGSYSLLQDFWKKFFGDTSSSVGHLVCGASSGIISKAAIYPMDLLKKRLQVQGFEGSTVSEVVEYRGLRHCAHVVYSTEGLRGFYKGLTAAALKSCATTGLVFFTYEYILELMRDLRHTDDIV